VPVLDAEILWAKRLVKRVSCCRNVVCLGSWHRLSKRTLVTIATQWLDHTKKQNIYEWEQRRKSEHPKETGAGRWGV